MNLLSKNKQTSLNDYKAFYAFILEKYSTEEITDGFMGICLDFWDRTRKPPL